MPVKTELDSAGRVSDTLPLDHPERPGHTYTGNADGAGFFDPRPFSGGTAPRVTIRELPVQRISVGFPPQDMTALNGPTRVIPKTMASHDPIPSLAEECDRRHLPDWFVTVRGECFGWCGARPEWMRMSTIAPVPAGSAIFRDYRNWQ